MVNLIGIAGEKQSGKDTVATIIQYLTSCDFFESLDDFKKSTLKNLSPWINKKFADKLKDIVCILLDCYRSDLENESFKNTPLGIDWTYYKYIKGNGSITLFSTLEEIYEECISKFSDDFCKKINIQQSFEQLQLTGKCKIHMDYIVKKEWTPRLLLQNIGTECFRNLIHPNIWVNLTFKNYKGVRYDSLGCLKKIQYRKVSNWIISDVRLPNEEKAIHNKKGIIIKIERYTDNKKDKHISENSIDLIKYDELIINNGTIQDLTNKVKIILHKHNIL